MKKFLGMAAALLAVLCLSLTVWAGVRPEPDFTKPAAVIADLEAMKREGQAKKAQLVVIKSNYAITTITNFIRLNPGGDPSILKQRWQEAYEEYKKMK
jgi:hypothetical protein